ncbi:MAG: Mth938-like domain-containing protein [Gammaproteobacteria bacterium]|nr:Mth938-like domain-containing protein [Gammaproteobacteria bacterium]MCW5583216.1 Mth938-like domain-containing protein [Gammaproteobacteria bacterium]
MATLDLDDNSAQFQIRSYQPGYIQVNEKIFTRSILIAPDKLIEDWQPQAIDELKAESLTPIISFKPDILLLGTGSTLVLIPVEVYGELINLGIGVEVMSTSAACRTFNVLSSENRKIMAALIVS